MASGSCSSSRPHIGRSSRAHPRKSQPGGDGMAKLKVGMISFDHVHADMRMKALLEQPEEVEIVAIAEADEPRGRASQDKYGGEYYRDYRELLARGDLDFVFIHSATSAHKQMVLD